jgi:hypothetical protein
MVPIQAVEANERYDERPQEQRKEGILGEGFQAVQAGHAIQAIAETPGNHKNFENIGKNEPGDGGIRHAGLQVVDKKPCQARWKKNRPDFLL